MYQHWKEFGRHYYSRHDYEEVNSEAASDLYSNLEKLTPKLVGKQFATGTVMLADNFNYKDPIDNSLTTNQGLRIILDDSSRIIIRLSGTGTKGATLRIYLERYISNPGETRKNPQIVLSDLITSINNLAEIPKMTGMNAPTVIT